MEMIKGLIIALVAMTTFASGIGGVVGGSSDGRLSPANNWNEIRAIVKKNRKLKITGDYAFVGSVVSIFDVCTDGQNFVTTKKMPVYRNVKVPRHMDNMDGERDGWASKVVGHEYRSYPLHAIHKERVCENDDKRCSYVDIDFIQRTTKKVSVEKFIKEEGSERREIFKKVFSKDYHVPNCE